MERKQPQNQSFAIMIIWLGIPVFIALAFVSYLSVRENTPSQFTIEQEVNQRAEYALQTAPVKGSANPDITLIEFGDFQCTYCADIQADLGKLLKEKDNIRIAWFHRINASHQESLPAAIASECAKEQGAFWEFHDLLFKNQANLSTNLYNQIASSLKLNTNRFRECLADPTIQEHVKKVNEFANDNNITSTPTIIYNEKRLEGLVDYNDLVNFLE